MSLKDWTSAYADCKAAIMIAPNNKTYREMLDKINAGKKTEYSKNKKQEDPILPTNKMMAEQFSKAVAVEKPA